MKKALTVFLILAGILVIAYPHLSEFYNDYKQDAILRQWEEDMMDLENIEIEEVGDDEQEDSLADRQQGDLEGVISIDKIDLKLPILTGAVHQNMKTSVASIDNTGSLGQIGNYGIAGHRNLTYGRNFNRLDELEIGDEIKIEDGEKSYIYKIYDKLYVYPKDTWVLNGNDQDREITLVTCHPIGVSTHRLIIKGKIIE